MKLLMLIGMLILSDPVTVTEVRELYAKAITESKAADSMLELLEEKNLNSPLLLAYKASAQALIAKHALNPYTKLNMLKVSATTFEQSVKMAPENIEIRFLRFSVQHYIPSWLGYSEDLEEDKKVIISNLPAQVSDFKEDYVQNIIDFLIATERCSKEELDFLKTFGK